MPSIRKSLISGVFYTAFAKYSNVFFSILIGAILARLLTPEDFGIVALVTVFVTFFNLLGDFGISKAVVQNQNLTKNDIQSIFVFSILFALALGALFFLAAPLISRFYDEPELIKISRLLALAVLFHALQGIPRALLEKNLEFKKIGIITVSTQLSMGIFAIILAYKGFSYYALVIRAILTGFLLFSFFYLISPIKIVFRIDPNAINKIIRFSVFNFMFNIINYFSRNGDNLLVGKFLGPSSLGFYNKAYRLMMLPVQNLTHVITPVMMPVLSKYQNDYNVIFNTYLKVVKVLATIGFPLSVFLFFSANEIVTIIYGPQWDQTIPVFKILALIIGVQMIYSSAGSVFLAINRTELLFYYGLISACILLSGISLGIFLGKSILAVGCGIAIAFTISFFIVYYMLIHVALGKSFLQFIKTLLFPLFISLIMIVPLWIYSKYVSENMFLGLALKVVISGLTFGAMYLSKREYREILQMGIKQYIRK
ncbi:PST family polysaccharide transporter [Desulfosalsimonas propionicica]|uniref:PST family polysaccharide transporter n=1 Tax=Desulfosalsimonas propionicica TaxID=332175 RepID=A0A7W0C976_9BACT|nr:lipopolysaccharide biosynthesis protein [Desulfosalsimonas propionicica]MBA2881483.1 PST family polysaccharide transporter [Desulfosalsimonas propionicica]